MRANWLNPREHQEVVAEVWIEHMLVVDEFERLASLCGNCRFLLGNSRLVLCWICMAWGCKSVAHANDNGKEGSLFHLNINFLQTTLPRNIKSWPTPTSNPLRIVCRFWNLLVTNCWVLLLVGLVELCPKMALKLLVNCKGVKVARCYSAFEHRLLCENFTLHSPKPYPKRPQHLPRQIWTET